MPRMYCLATFVLLMLGGKQSVAQDCSGGTFLVSAAAVTGLALYDIATAPASARRYNQRHLAVVPHVDPRHGSYGLSVSVPFGRVSHSSPPAARKSPGTAIALSFTATAAPMLAGVAVKNDAGGYLFLGGLIVGPSVGHLYAEQFGRGLGTIALRGLGTVVGIGSIIGCFSD